MNGWKRTTAVVCCLALTGATLGTWLLADLDTAGQTASVVGCVVGIAGLLFTVLQPAGATRRATRTGTATVFGGGRANTGVASRQGGEAADTGDARSDGGIANTGVADGL
ncbi:MAG TPA: hypothetical protein VIU15_17420 [Streptomyces sp.]